MTIATLMATSAIFLVNGWTAPAFGPPRHHHPGGVVCIAASLKRHLTGPQDGLHHRFHALEAAGRPDDREWSSPPSSSGGPSTSRHQPQGIPRRRPALGHQCLQLRRGHANRHNAFRNDPCGAADKSTTVHQKSEYVILNALGSSELADGKYLYSPASHQIEVQWIPGHRVRPPPASSPHGHRHQRHSHPQAPWGLVMMGVFLVIAVELLGIRSLCLSLSAPISPSAPR